MTKQYVLVSLALCLGAASCAKSPSTKSAEGGGVIPAAAPTQVDAGAPQATPEAKPQAAKAGAPKAPAIPAGAEWTIHCTAIPGAGHVVQSTQLRDQLARSTGMRDWYVIHGDNESTLYYGFYKSLDKSAKATREKIDAMTDATGNRPFRNAVIVELTAPDPDAPPQWDLANAPPGMVWSVQIAAYEGSPQRKKVAVEAVREARAQGVPAYYYHGPSVSSVCVGAWPSSSVRGDMEPAFNDPNQKRPMDQIVQQQPADLIVLPPGMPPVNKELRGRDNRRLRAVTPTLEVVDPALLGTLKTYPHHYRNGEPEGMQTKNGLQPKPSFLVKIQRRPGGLLGGGDSAVAGAGRGDGRGAGRDPAPRRPDPFGLGSQPAAEQRPAPGYGKLPSLGGD